MILAGARLRLASSGSTRVVGAAKLHPPCEVVGQCLELVSRGGRPLASAAKIHPPLEQQRLMIDAVVRFFQGLEQHPPPLAGSGYKWVLDGNAHEERAHVEKLVASLPMEIREGPVLGGLDAIIQTVLELAVRCSTNDNSPGYMAYIPSGGLFHSAVADLLGAAINRYVTINVAAPGLAAIERSCISWMCQEVIGWPASKPSGGVLTSGGAFANLLALHAARTAKIQNRDLPSATVYVSEQSHYCVDMGAKFVGIQPENVRKVPSEPRNLRMDIDALRSMIASDVEQSLKPLAVCAMGGTTNSGAVDDFEAISDICNEHGCWLHVDAAYGGFFALTPEGRSALKGMELADSVVMDPHKSLFLPYGLGALLVRDQFHLQKGNRTDGACMQPPSEVGSGIVEDMMNLSPELTRNFRGLRMWLPLQILGVEPFRAQLAEKLWLARRACSAINLASIPGLRIVMPPQLSIFTFKLDDTTKSGSELDLLNKAFLDEIHSKGNVLLSPFRSVSGVPGELSIRMAILSHHTDVAIVDIAVADVLSAAVIVQDRDAQPTPRAATDKMT
eukprot:TRINITY_DN10111_c0_g1_i1.p1 TRINITY_DN10111_c0_g1~~TRINITY_DN10111_c0_g1_i1.p1  ORF type:complete len:560 (+),score=65.73 TRINITY_DN10111_c0_g1_i1:56-1735(+)